MVQIIGSQIQKITRYVIPLDAAWLDADVHVREQDSLRQAVRMPYARSTRYNLVGACFSN